VTSTLMKISPLCFFGLGIAGGLSALSGSTDAMRLAESSAAIQISRGDIPVLTYHKAEVPAPAGEDDAYRRSGFIHPLHSPRGAVVTGIHAPDHIHHMGVWHAWVSTEFRGEKLDFWNMKAREGSVRYAGALDLNESGESVGFRVRQEQFKLGGDTETNDEVVLAEKLSVSATLESGANVIDYIIEQRNVTDATLKLPAYRYGGGLAFRAPESWGEETSDYLTSEGLDRKEGHATRGRWCMMYGPTEYGEASVVIMGHPSNHDAPQRMRIWPEGKVFFNYAPTQEFDWEIAPNEEIKLHYRILVFDGRATVQEIERHWSAFTQNSED